MNFFSINRIYSLIMIAFFPSCLILVILFARGDIDLSKTLIALGFLFILTLLLLFPFLQDIRKLVIYARDIEQSQFDALPPALHHGILEDLCIALRQIHRSRRQVREELAEKIRSYQNLFDSLPLPVFLLDIKRRVVSENLVAREIFGRHPQMYDLGIVLRHPDLLESVDQVITQGKTRKEIIFSLPLPHELQYRALIEGLDQVTSEGTMAILVLHDITALKRIDQMRTDFIANASHELRTPLASISGFIETLKNVESDDKETRYNFLSIMQDQAIRMTRLVNDLLSLSRIELQEHLRPEGKVDIIALLNTMILEFYHSAHQRGIDIRFEHPDHCPLIKGQETEIQQVFQNLIDNAVKYGYNNSSIMITISENEPPQIYSKIPYHDSEDPYLKISVIDKGEGIPREHLPRLTERFFRVDSARSREMGGTGLGLAIVKHIINRHRGFLEIDSILGEGSRFSVYLPIEKR
jgi:two-component system phosphate regulon sensor histidine kinase PhoR